MTTDVQVEFVEDSTVKNDVCNLSRELLTGASKVGAASWTASTRDPESRACMINNFVATFDALDCERSLWLICGDSSWQKNSRVIQHKRFWGRLRSKVGTLDSIDELLEYACEQDDKIKFFGAALVSKSNVDTVLRVICRTGNCYLVSVKNSTNFLETVLKSGWEDKGWFDYDLLKRVLAAEELLFKPVGEFDDPDYGFVCVGSPERVMRLTN